MAHSNRQAMQADIALYRKQLEGLARSNQLSGPMLYNACQKFKQTYLANHALYQKEGRSVWADEAELNIMAALLGRSIAIQGTGSEAGLNWEANGADLDPTTDTADATPIAVKWNGSHYFRKQASDTKGDGKCAFHAIAAQYTAKFPSANQSSAANIVAGLKSALLRPAPKPSSVKIPVIPNHHRSVIGLEHKKLNDLLDKGTNRAAFEQAFDQGAQRVSSLAAHSLWKMAPTPPCAQKHQQQDQQSSPHVASSLLLDG